MSEPVHVAVLLSSYNGARYIAQQITSIMQQRGVTVHLLVRDDGSSDDTCAIVRGMAEQYQNIELVSGTNLGVIGSFFWLLANAPPDCDYYSFADQDDVWHADKLSRAVTMLSARDQGTVLAYCSAVEFVDENLLHIANSEPYTAQQIGLDNALVQNVATGCTMVLNGTARSRIVARLPQCCVMHDWWIYLVVTALGTMVYDPVPSMQYRQHAGNVIGVARSRFDHFRRRVRRFLDGQAVSRSGQLQELDRLFGADLAPARRAQLRRLAFYRQSLAGRLSATFSSGFRRQSLIDELLVRVTVLIGKF